MALVTLTTGPSAALDGTISIPATLIDPTADTVTLAWDITQHLAGHPAAMTMICDVSQDGGTTWARLYSGGRDQGYDPDLTSKTPGIASVRHPLPGAGNALRMVRCSLGATASVTTSGQLIPIALGLPSAIIKPPASVAVDAVSATAIVFNSVTSFSGTPITATASATALTGSVIFQGSATHPTTVSATWNSVAMSIVTGADTGFFTDGVDQRAVLYGLASPASGAKTFAGSWTNSYSGYANVMSWKGTDTTTPFKNGTNLANAASSGTTASITVTSPANDFAVGCLTAFPTINSANQTSWWLSNAGSQADGAANYTAGAGSTSLTCTLQISGNFGYAACDVQVPIAAGQVPYNPWPQWAPLLAQKRRALGWTPHYDHRFKRRKPMLVLPRRGLILPRRGLIKAA